MDWANEPWIKFYPKVTEEDALLTWEARALWHEMLRRFDTSGIIKVRRGARGLAALVLMPLDVVERVLPELLEDGRIKPVLDGFIAPNYVAAQSARSSDKLRKQQERERRRTDAMFGNGHNKRVTHGHSESLAVTATHDESQSVTLRSEEKRSERSDARARVVVSEDGNRNPKLRYQRSAINPDEIEAYDGDTLVGILEDAGAGKYREVKP